MGEGSASVACGCDISLACAGIQTEENWPDTAAAAAAAAAAAETIEGLQQELVGGHACSTERPSFMRHVTLLLSGALGHPQ